MSCTNRNKDPNRPKKENGYQRNLYRNTRDGKIAGVCAGFADYFDVPIWVARLVCISLVIFTFQFGIIAYIVAVFMIAKREKTATTSRADDYRSANTQYQSRSNKVFNYSKSASNRLQDIRDRLRKLDEKIGSMEGYVTSKRYRTTTEINDLK
ncbi:MAG: phage shock protein C [Oceanospirillaceae bacterium]|jgi:phage shock protein C